MMDLLIEQAANWHHYTWIVFALILTGCGLPLPEEIFIVAAGVMSSGPDAKLYPAFAFVACMAGVLAGDSMMYLIGRFCGRPLIEKSRFLSRIFPIRREQKMEQLIRDHGLKMFFLARFMVGVRAPMYLAAGMMRVPWRVFIVVDAICATVVVGAVFLLSMIFGDDISGWIRQYQEAFTILVILGVLIAVAVYFIRRKREAREAAEESEAALESERAESVENETSLISGEEVVSETNRATTEQSRAAS